MKRNRQKLILGLIEKYELATQEELIQKLRDHGLDVTQATVSRDIKELRLVKSMGLNGKYRYVINQADTDEDGLVLKYQSIFVNSVISADYAGNIICIRCYTGMANAACAAFDSMRWEGLVGTLAGDDTIFALCRTEGYASQMKDAIRKILGKH